MTNTAPPEPMRIDVLRLILVGLGVWALALVLTLAVPALHTGARQWWPWSCVCGLILGGLGYLYVWRGRGNASSA
ncbi:DUF2530 domain-containing protein [Metallococcus carri]|uniref:DUF2530 domain-containing protein n=1 Tax=Metallococcus carri TaxID=1656884 RepID=UPI002E2B269C|nr:DUF2530 domain-containing protein [Metallococcus carri]